MRKITLLLSILLTVMGSLFFCSEARAENLVPWTLYTDGHLVINGTNDEYGDVMTDGEIDIDKEYTYTSGKVDVPWFDNKADIYFVEFANKTQPTTMANWFRDVINLESFNVENLDTSVCTDMNHLFYCYDNAYRTNKLTSIDFSSLDVSNCNDLSYIFFHNENLIDVDLTSWMPPSGFNAKAMFYGCSNLTTIFCENSWECGDNDYGYDIFFSCKKLTSKSAGSTEYYTYKQTNPKTGYFTWAGYKPQIKMLVSFSSVDETINWDFKNKPFTFTIKANEDSPEPLDEKVTTDTNGLVDFKTIFFPEYEHEYSYTMTQEAVSYNGKEFPEKTFTVKVVCHKKEPFNNSVTLTYDDEVEKEAGFNKTDLVLDKASIDYRYIKIKNTVSGLSSETSLDYTFTITGDDGYSNTVSVKNGKEVLIDDITYGTYHISQNEFELPDDYRSWKVTCGGEDFSAGKDFTISAEKPYIDLDIKNTFSDPIWTLYKDGHLVINGTNDKYGEVSHSGTIDWRSNTPYTSYSSAPWYNYRKSITSVEFAKETAPKHMAYWFYECTALKEFDATNLKTDDLQTLNSTFYDTGISNLDFMSELNLEKVTTLYNCFHSCGSLNNTDGLKEHKMAALQSLSYTFNNTGISSLNFMSNWNVSAVTTLNSTFKDCKNLARASTSLSTDWSSLTDMTSAFEGSGITSLDFMSNWNMSAVTTLNSTFKNCKSLEGASTSPSIDWSSLTDMTSAFEGSGITSLDFMSNWNAGAVTTLNSAFKDCTYLTGASTSPSIDWASLTDMESAFTGSSIKSLDFLSNWNVSAVQTLAHAFENCKNLTGASTTPSIDWASLTTLESTFKGSGITNLNFLTKWNVANVTTLKSTFENCDALTDVAGLTKPNWASLQTMANTFHSCDALVVADLYNFNPKNLSPQDLAGNESLSMTFAECPNLVTILCNNTWEAGSGSNTFYASTKLYSPSSNKSWSLYELDSSMCNPKSGYFTNILEIAASDVFSVAIDGAPSNLSLDKLCESGTFSFTVTSLETGSSLKPHRVRHDGEGNYSITIAATATTTDETGHTSFAPKAGTYTWKLTQDEPDDERFYEGYDKTIVYLDVTASAGLEPTLTIKAFRNEDKSEPIDTVVFTNKYANIGNNPNFTIQHYVWFNEISTPTTAEERQKTAYGKSNAITMGFIDTTNANGYKPTSTTIDTNMFKKGGNLPAIDTSSSPRDSSYPKIVTAFGLIEDTQTEDIEYGRLFTKKILTRLYADEETEFRLNSTLAQMDRLYRSELQEEPAYILTEIWVANPADETEAAKAKASVSSTDKYASGNRIFTIYTLPEKPRDITQIRFTNDPDDENISEADASGNVEWKDGFVIPVNENTIVRYIFKQSTSKKDLDANFFDYDLSDGGFETTSDGYIEDTAEQPNYDEYSTIYVDTHRNGINSEENYKDDEYSGTGGGVPLSFGNQNTGVETAQVEWNRRYINKYNSGVYNGCSFKLVTGMARDEDGYPYPIWNEGINAPNLFGKNDMNSEGEDKVLGKTTYTDYKLGFYREGDTYTLDTVSRDGYGETIGTLRNFKKTVSGVVANQFWAMENYCDSYGTKGHDIKFGSVLNPYRDLTPQYSVNSWRYRISGSGSPFPPSDDGTDHNSYYGMSYEADFQLAPGYVGPLEYWFFGDDDMWVFIDDLDDDAPATMVADVGGVHTSVGEYVNLWDYVAPTPLDAEESKNYKLTVFYTERGASGSSCYMRITAPLDPPEVYGDLSVEKTVTGENPPDGTYNFTVTLDDRGIEGYYGDMKFEKGVAKFTLKDGAKKVAEELPAGIHYKVEEETPDGFVASWTNEDGFIGDGVSEVKCENHWDNSVSYTPKVTKLVNDYLGKKIEEWNFRTKQFAFTIEAADPDNPAPLPSKLEATTDETGVASWESIPLSLSTTYNYIVREVHGDVAGVTYDETPHTLTVSVDAEGEITEMWDGSEVAPTVTNTYSPSATLAIKLQKEYLEDNDERTPLDIADRQFSFTLRAETDGAPMPDDAVAYTDTTGKVEWGEIAYRSEGEWDYTVQENNPNDPDIVFDDTPYPLHVSVKQDGDGLSVTYEWGAKANEITSLMKSMTLEEKVAQMFFDTPGAVSAVNTTLEAGEDEIPIGGFILYSENITTPSATKALTKHIHALNKKVQPFIGVDEEGGLVARLANNSSFRLKKYDDAYEVAASGGVDAVSEMGNYIGNYLNEYGFDVDFAPDADVFTNPSNKVIGTRSFSSDPNVVAECDRAFADGLNANGVTATFKHFPGHGDTSEDSHAELATTSKTLEELRQCEFIPFTEASENDFVMVGHIAAEKVTGDMTPASLSKTMVTDILKDELGFKGLVVTDGLAMGGVTKGRTSAEVATEAIKAGVDILLRPENLEEAYSGVLEAVRSGDITEERINESVYKILSRKYDIGLLGEKESVDTQNLVVTNFHKVSGPLPTTGNTGITATILGGAALCAVGVTGTLVDRDRKSKKKTKPKHKAHMRHTAHKRQRHAYRKPMR